MENNDRFIEGAGCAWGKEIEAYLAGETDDASTVFLAQHVRQCFYCRQQMRDARRLMWKLQQNDIRLGQDLAGKIVARIPPDAWKADKNRFRDWRTRISLAAAAILVFCACWWLSWRPTALSSMQSGLAWLAERQRDDGAWNIQALGGQPQYTVGLTALALTAFMEGNSERHRLYVERGLVYLVKQQQESGLFGPSCEEAMYNHAIATTALLKADRNGMLDAGARARLDRALRFICSEQNATGGWGHLHARQTNADISFWQLQALQQAYTQGWHKVKKHMDIGQKWCKEFGEECVVSGETWQTGQPVSSNGNELNYYRIYFFANIRKKGDGQRHPWQEKINDLLLSRQIRSGDYKGSWEPGDGWGKSGGRIYSTAMAVLCLPLLAQ